MSEKLSDETLGVLKLNFAMTLTQMAMIAGTGGPQLREWLVSGSSPEEAAMVGRLFDAVMPIAIAQGLTPREILKGLDA